MITEVRHKSTLIRLLDSGFIPASACGETFRDFVVSLIHTRVLEWERRGSGQRLIVSNPGALSDFIRLQFPHEADEILDISSRVEAVARFRDTKALRNNVPEIVSVRTWRDGALLFNGKPVETVNATACHGVFSFLLGSQSSYSLAGDCALVEGPAIFTEFERLSLAQDLVLYGHGRISNRMLDWLATASIPNFKLLHFPDYDPIGLNEFERLRARLGERVRLHIPDSLPRLFAAYSKKSLLQPWIMQFLLMKLRSSKHSEIQFVTALIDQHNAGLEQEALLVEKHKPPNDLGKVRE